MTIKNEYSIVLHKQFDYVKSLLEKRKIEFLPLSLTKDIGFEDNSPFKVFKHAVIALYHFSTHDFFPEDFGNRKDIFNSDPEDLVEEIIQKYNLAIDEFDRAIMEISEEKYSEIKENLGNLIMHVVGHIGQAIRLQKLNMSEETKLKK